MEVITRFIHLQTCMCMWTWSRFLWVLLEEEKQGCTSLQYQRTNFLFFFSVTCVLSAVRIRLLLVMLNTFWRVILGLARVSCIDRNFTGLYEFLSMKTKEISNSISLICLPPIINSLSYACHFSATNFIFLPLT